MSSINTYLSPLHIRGVRFYCNAEKNLDVQIPQLRGTFGLALHQVDEQLYKNVFDCQNPKYIVRPDLQCNYEKSKTFSFEFLAWNITDEQYKTLLTAWNIVAMYGLGKERVRFKIVKAEPLPPLVRPLTNVRTLTFPHSVRLMKKGHLLTELTFYDIILAVLYRLAPMIAEANGRTPSVQPKDDWLPQYQQIIDLTKTVKSVWHGEKLTLQRYSARQQREVKQDGVFGIMTVDNVPDDLLPLLEIADTLHIGKATIMGLGRVITQ
jgi:hypothetical protein